MNLEVNLRENLSPNEKIYNEQPQNLPMNSEQRILIEKEVMSLIETISSEPYDISILKNIEMEFSPIIDDEEMNLIEKDQPYMLELFKNIESVAKTHLKGYDPFAIPNFKFELPHTSFNHLSKEIKVFRKENNPEFLETNRLSCSQICEIFKKGFFTVKSKKFKQDYVWKISGWIVKGRVNIVKSFKDDMETACDMLEDWGKAFYRGHTNGFCEANIYNSLKYSFYFVRNLISIFLGYPKKYAQNTDSSYYFALDYAHQLFQDENFDKSVWLYFFERKKINAQIKENENGTYLSKLQEKFDEIWKKQKYNEEKKLENNENMKINLLKVYYERLYQYILENNQQLDAEKLLKLLEYFKCFQNIRSKVHIYERALRENVDIYANNLRKTSCLAKIDSYYESKKKEYEIKEKNSLDNERNNKLIEEFDLNNFVEESSLFKRYLKFNTYFEQNYKLANLLMRKYAPYRNFRFMINLFPSSWRVESYKYGEELRYHLIRHDEVKYHTNHCFWRIFIMFVRYRVWVQNAFYWLFVMAVVGPLGIRALCGTEAFYPDKKCDPNTGVISVSYDSKTETVISRFILVLDSIRDDRNEFESQPDTGFFGKRFARICNLLYNYVFKFIFVGIFLVLCCFPLLIIFNVLICLLLAFTSFLWMPLVLIFLKVFQVLIYDNDNEKPAEGQDSNTFQYFPLFGEIFITFGVKCLLQFLFACFLIIIKPILFVLVVIFGIFRYVFRSIYDLFMMIFVCLFGRVPATESSIAWKISGPVISQRYYDKMQISDAAKVYLSKLELIELNKYESEMRSEIRKYYENAEKFYKTLNKPFGINASIKYFNEKNDKFLKTYQSNLHTLKTSEEKLLKTLNLNINDRKKIYPYESLYNVRFKKNEIEFLEVCCKQVLESFLFKRNIQSHWENRDLLDPEQLNAVNREMIISTINSNVFEPFEEIDERAELIDVRQPFGTISDVLEGKRGNANENLGIIMKKEKESKEVKYISVEDKANISFLGSDSFSVNIANSIKINVNFSEDQMKKIQEFQIVKERIEENKKK